MGEGAFEQVADLLVEQQGIDRESIHPQSTLVDDLRMWGDDIVEFFLALEAKFGTDFSGLKAEWASHFPPEGGSWKHLALSLPVLIIGGIGAGFAVSATDLPPFWAVPAAAGLVFAILWLVSRWLRGPDLVPVTVAQVAEAVARGNWA